MSDLNSIPGSNRASAEADLILSFVRRSDNTDYEVKVLKDRHGALPVDGEGYLMSGRVVVREGDTWPWIPEGSI